MLPHTVTGAGGFGKLLCYSVYDNSKLEQFELSVGILVKSCFSLLFFGPARLIGRPLACGLGFDLISVYRTLKLAAQTANGIPWERHFFIANCDDMARRSGSLFVFFRKREELARVARVCTLFPGENFGPSGAAAKAGVDARLIAAIAAYRADACRNAERAR